MIESDEMRKFFEGTKLLPTRDDHHLDEEDENEFEIV